MVPSVARTPTVPPGQRRARAAAVSRIMWRMGMPTRPAMRSAKKWAVLQVMAMAAQPQRSSSRASARSCSSGPSYRPDRMAPVRSGMEASLSRMRSMWSWSRSAAVCSVTIL